MKQITVGTTTGQQAADLIYANDLENQPRAWTARAYELNERATQIFGGSVFLFRSKITANSAVIDEASLYGSGNWELLGLAPLQIFPSTAAAIAARPLAKRRQGDTVGILTVNGMVLYGWMNGVTDEQLTTVSPLNAFRTVDGRFVIADPTGKIALLITEDGQTNVAKFTDSTIRRFYTSDIFHVINNSSGRFDIADADGKRAFSISPDGLVGIAGFDGATAQRIINLVDSGTPTTLHDKIWQKKVSILGDSISTDNGGGNAGLVYPQQYWGRLQDLQQCQIYRSAIGGTTIATSPTGNPFTTPARWQSVNSVFEPDVILIFGGINDFLQDVALGVSTDTTVATFYGALDYLYRSLLAWCPMARLFHMTPLHTTFSQGGGLIPEYNGQNFLSEYIEAIRVVTRRYGVGMIDTNQNSGITCFNVETLAGDKIHIRAAGHMMVYNTIVGETNVKL